LPPRKVSGKVKFIRHALESAATEERQLQLFDRLFTHASETQLYASREKLEKLKVKYFALKREKLRARRNKPDDNKDNKEAMNEWRADYDDICIDVEEIDSQVFDLRKKVQDDENTRIAAWRLLLPRLVPEYKVIEIKDGNIADSPLVKMLEKVLKGKIENNEVTDTGILDDIDDAVYDDV